MATRIVHSNGLLKQISTSYDLTKAADILAALEDLKEISIRKDLGETLRDKMLEELVSLRRAACGVLEKAGYPTADGVYLQTEDGYRWLSSKDAERLQTSSPAKGERRLFVKFPFFRFKKMTAAHLASQLIFEIDLMIDAADGHADGWEMVSRALRFSRAYYDFRFEVSGANRLADAEYRRKRSQKEGIIASIENRRRIAKSWQDTAVAEASKLRRRNPTLSISALAERLAPKLGHSVGHVSRVLRTRRSELEGGVI